MIIMLRRYANSFVFKLNRYKNELRKYDYPAENNGWVKVGDRPVLGNSTTGTMFDPFVYEHNGRVYMVVSERLTGNLVCFDSSDGLNWLNEVNLLDGVEGTWQTIVNRASVVVKDGMWHMWYTGQDGTCSRIGYAVSEDGIHYHRIQEDPVLSPCEGEGVSVMNPHVIWNNNKQCFQMWYAAGEDYEPDIICYAESLDGILWSNRQQVLAKEPSNRWEKAKVGGCHVMLDMNGLYNMFYIGYQNVDVARICIAHSRDGINWVRPENNLLIAPSKGSWDADATYKPTVIEKNSTMYMWYNGRRAHEEYIGLAIKEN